VGDGIGEDVVVAVAVTVMMGDAVAVTVGSGALAGIPDIVTWATAVKSVAVTSGSG